MRDDDDFVTESLRAPIEILFHEREIRCTFADGSRESIARERIVKLGVYPFTRMPMFILDDRTGVVVPRAQCPSAAGAWYDRTGEPPPGAAKWKLVVRAADGRTKELTIGPFDEARARDVARMHEMAAGRGSSSSLTRL